MKKIINPLQNWLFDPFEVAHSTQAIKLLREGWSGVFRQVILVEMPVEKLGEHFNETIGRPTKELYSISGLLLLKEMFNWTEEEAVKNYVFNTEVQYALNLGRDNLQLDIRTLQRNEKLFREDELAQEIMDAVTIKLVKLLELDISKQRLDSTHVNSNMATFGRLRLFGVTIKRFLKSLHRNEKALHSNLPEELLKRYMPGENRLFDKVGKDTDSRSLKLVEVASDLLFLVDHFSQIETVTRRTTYKSMAGLLKEQCDVQEDQLKLKKKTGGNVMQNSSDKDATYDGHKGAGYKAQLSQTSTEGNCVQLITDVIVETAVISDAKLIQPQLDNLTKKEMLPNEVTADTTYGSDENVEASKAKGVEQISPVAGKPKDAQSKESSRMTPKEQRLDRRRKEQETTQWKEKYKSRNPIDAANSGIKRRTGMGILAVRGKPAVSHAIFLKIAGWNILRSLTVPAFIKKTANVLHKQVLASDCGDNWSLFHFFKYKIRIIPFLRSLNRFTLQLFDYLQNQSRFLVRREITIVG